MIPPPMCPRISFIATSIPSNDRRIIAFSLYLDQYQLAYLRYHLFTGSVRCHRPRLQDDICIRNREQHCKDIASIAAITHNRLKLNELNFQHPTTTKSLSLVLKQVVMYDQNREEASGDRQPYPGNA